MIPQLFKTKNTQDLGLSPEQEALLLKLDPIYDEMRTRQLRVLKTSKKMRSDEFFAKPENAAFDSDERRCYAIISIIDETVDCNWTDAFEDLMFRLKSEFGENNLRYFQKVEHVDGNGGILKGQLHWTLMQLVGFADFDKEIRCFSETKYKENTYLDCIQDSLTVGGMHQEIKITFIGVILVSTGLLMVGVPNIDVNDARDLVRQKLAERSLPLKEPFVNDIVHSTLFRLVGEKNDQELHSKLVALAKDFERINLGTVTLKKFQVGPASWRMLSEEVDASPALRKWTLGDKSPWEVYEEDLITGKKHHSVSGVSGFGLAKEIRGALLAESLAEQIEGSDEERSSKPDIEASTNSNPQSNHLSDIFQPQNSTQTETLSPETSRSHIDSTRSFASFSSYVTEESHVATRFQNMNVTSTVSGAAGQDLVLELKKKKEDEERLMWSLYYTDFH